MDIPNPTEAVQFEVDSSQTTDPPSMPEMTLVDSSAPIDHEHLHEVSQPQEGNVILPELPRYQGNSNEFEIHHEEVDLAPIPEEASEGDEEMNTDNNIFNGFT